jgi:signal peptidase I
MESVQAETPIPESVGVPKGVAERAPSPVVHESTKGTLADVVESLLVTILLALFGTTFIVQAFKIPSQSMEPTLLVGDHLLVNKFIFEGTGAWYDKLLPYRPIRHGDIVVFKFPFDDHPHYVKRVIGIPGDHIRISDEQVYVNDHQLSEPYVIRDPAVEDPYTDNYPPATAYSMGIGLRPEWAQQISKYVSDGELVVPPDHYFVMGDNRDRSWDSRYWGFVDRNSIMGRPMVIYWSVEATSDDYDDRSLGGTVRGIDQTMMHLSSSTRWHRMLREVH